MQKFEFILDYINQQGGCTKEHQLLCFIEENHPEFFSPLEKPSLFKKHFFLFHQLYHLNEALISVNQCLIISALEIRLCSIKEAGTDIGHNDGLKAFYLDEKNLHLSDKEVTEMMQLFWKKYLALEQKSDAIKTLGLQNEKVLTREIVKKRFNQLAKEHHPDKGGNNNVFVKIKQAYDELKILL